MNVPYKELVVRQFNVKQRYDLSYINMHFRGNSDAEVVTINLLGIKRFFCNFHIWEIYVENINNYAPRENNILWLLLNVYAHNNK